MAGYRSAAGFRVAESARPALQLVQPSSSTLATPQTETDASLGLASLSWTLLVYVVGLAMFATLAPFNFVPTPHPTYDLDVSAPDVLLNLALLFPAGFLYRMARAKRAVPGHALDAFVLGMGFSLLLEGLQFYLPGRCPSPVDVLTNGAGAWAGAYAHSLFGPWFDRQLHRQLTLELPLTNVAYLTIPLLWLDALSHPQRAQHVLSLPLGLMLALIGAALHRHRAAHKPIARAALGVASVFALGTLPGMLLHPWLGFADVLGIYAATHVLCVLQAKRTIVDRRFEAATARHALPLLLVYFALLGAYPWRSFGLRHASFAAGVVFSASALRPQVLALLESVAAFSLLGYLCAEQYARARITTLAVVARVSGFGACVALGLQTLAGAHPGAHASVVVIAVMGLASAVGAGLHRGQIALAVQRRSVPPPRVSGEFASSQR